MYGGVFSTGNQERGDMDVGGAINSQTAGFSSADDDPPSVVHRPVHGTSRGRCVGLPSIWPTGLVRTLR